MDGIFGKITSFNNFTYYNDNIEFICENPMGAHDMNIISNPKHIQISLTSICKYVKNNYN